MKSTPASASPSSRKKKTTTGNSNESRTINNWSLHNCTHPGTTNQFSSRHPGHENWISLKRQTIIFEKEKHFCSLMPRMDQNGLLQRFEIPQPRKALSHGSNSGSQKKKSSKGAAVFPEVKRMIKRLKRTPANRASASSTLNQPWFRSGRLNRPGLNQRKLQCSLAVTNWPIINKNNIFPTTLQAS